MVNSSSWLAISCATSPKTRGFGKSYRKIFEIPPTRSVASLLTSGEASLDVIKNVECRAGKDLFLLVLTNIRPFDRRHRAIDRSEQVRVVAAHHHVIRAHHVSHHRQRVWTKRNSVVVQTLQIETRQLIDLRA